VETVDDLAGLLLRERLLLGAHGQSPYATFPR
jgi:hypothetical protein